MGRDKLNFDIIQPQAFTLIRQRAVANTVTAKVAQKAFPKPRRRQLGMGKCLIP